MSIVSSVFSLVGPAQKDGRQYVREKHIDNVGIAHVVEYLAAVGTNYAAVMNARAPIIAAQLQDQEYANAVGVDADPKLIYQTVAEFLARFRAAYLSATGAIAAQLSFWIKNRNVSGWATVAALQLAFGFGTALQMTNLLNGSIATQHDAYSTVQSSQGQ